MSNPYKKFEQNRSKKLCVSCGFSNFQFYTSSPLHHCIMYMHLLLLILYSLKLLPLHNTVSAPSSPHPLLFVLLLLHPICTFFSSSSSHVLLLFILPESSSPHPLVLYFFPLSYLHLLLLIL